MLCCCQISSVLVCVCVGHDSFPTNETDIRGFFFFPLREAKTRLKKKRKSKEAKESHTCRVVRYFLLNTVLEFEFQLPVTDSVLAFKHIYTTKVQKNSRNSVFPPSMCFSQGGKVSEQDLCLF